ncbi:hypothetical protein BaRGS_00014803 [Batillaria attramentaria]|uniref:Ig-like domain-containing protein n=1 Tax=Batillaria attramentaria TaxID=370345 RepID=A0ABD0L3S5_9CAEN
MVDCSKKGLVAVPKDLPSWVTILDLKSNAISTLGPDDFKGLHKLKELDLSQNKDITFINGSLFQDLDSLCTLKITHTQLTEMPIPTRPLNITELSLTNNMILTVSPEALQAMPALENLYLSHNRIMDIPIGAFPSRSRILRLHLNNNKIMRLEKGCLDNLTSLEQLKLNKNQMFELKKDVFLTLSNLKFLELSRNKISSIQGLAFKGLEKLQVLKLKRNSIATLLDGAFWGLSSISNLQLDNNNISNVTKGWLYGLKSLRQLSLAFNKIESIEQDGWKFCEDLNRLDLTNNQLKTIYPGTFSKLKHLENLLLDHNKVSRIDDGAFRDLAELITLEMNDNAIAWTMEDVSGAFDGLQNLMRLGLKMNHIKSITKQAFLGLNSLRQLHLEDNDITTIQENSFQPLQDLRELRLNSTNLLCDCHISWLPAWLSRFGFQNTVIAVCSYPEWLRGKSIFDVPVEDFKCSDQEIPKPIILSNPVSQDAFKGANVSLNCTAAITGDAQPTIQWKKDNVVLPAASTETLATSDGDIKRYTSRLHLRNIRDDMAGRYQCVVSNDFGSAFSHRAKINVYVFPVFIKKPVDITVKAGQSAKLQCSATGQPQPVISWQKDGGDDFPAARERRMHVIPNDDQFFIVSTRNIDEGVYTCMARNDAGVIATNATVTILETPGFIREMKDEMTTRVGETSVLECMASGSPRPKLQWLKDSQALEVTPRHFFTADNQLLIIVETKWEDQGTYTCEMSNTLGIMRGRTKLRVMSRDGQPSPGASKGGGGLDDTSTTTGIIIIAVVCCVVGTSLVWVIIIYQTRKRHEMYSATPTDETTLPGEPASTGYSSSDKEGSFTQGPIGITTYHYQDYQLKESGYESSSGQYRANGWTGMRPSAAIFPSDVDEDDLQGAQLSASQQQLRCQNRATSVSSLHHTSEESDTAGSSHSPHSSPSHSPGPQAPLLSPSVPGATSSLQRGGSTLSTFHPGPTNHDRCPRSIALPVVCGESSSGSTMVATTQTPTNCECDTCDVHEAHTDCKNCERCCQYQQQRQMASGDGSISDSNTHQRSVPPVPLRASSFSALPTGAWSLRPPPVGVGCCCQSVPCSKHKNGLVPRKQQHRHTELCSHDCGCDGLHAAVCPSCSHHTCTHALQGE